MVAPPSKSMAHRLLIGGGLAKGESVIEGISGSEDMKATLDCLSAIGAKYKIEGDKVTITGADIRNIPEGAVLKWQCAFRALKKGSVRLVYHKISKKSRYYTNI